MLRHTVVLIADDHPTPRKIAKKILVDQLNCGEVIETKTADEAWRMIEKGERVDWIISDWEMPGMTGDEFLLKIRNNPKTADIPFMMMSSRNDKDALITAAQAGVSDFLIKPFSAATLIQKVRKIFLSCERRLLERFKASSRYPVQLFFEGAGEPRSASLVDVSIGGCMVKTPHFGKGESVNVYDTVDIVIEVDQYEIRLDGELVRVERDRDNLKSKDFVMAGFQFNEVAPGNREKLFKLIESVKVKLPDKIG